MFIPVIGAGSIGRRHSENLVTLGVRTELIPWRGFDEAAFRRIGADAVVIATATQVRLPLVRLCAELDIPFYVEKPLSHDEATVDAILDSAGALAPQSMVGFMMRYHPAFRDLAARDLSGIFDASFGIGHDVRQWRKNWRFADSYAARADGGGVLLDLSHEIDMALALFPAAQVASVTSLGHPRFPGVDFATRLGLVSTAMVGSVAMDYLSPVSHRRIILRGSDQEIDYDLIGCRYRVSDGRTSSELFFPLERNEMFLGAMSDFLTLVRGKPISDPALVPRLDLVADHCRAIAAAWAARRFCGSVGGSYE